MVVQPWTARGPRSVRASNCGRRDPPPALLSRFAINRQTDALLADTLATKASAHGGLVSRSGSDCTHDGWHWNSAAAENSITRPRPTHAG